MTQLHVSRLTRKLQKKGKNSASGGTSLNVLGRERKSGGETNKTEIHTNEGKKI